MTVTELFIQTIYEHFGYYTAVVLIFFSILMAVKIKGRK